MGTNKYSTDKVAKAYRLYNEEKLSIKEVCLRTGIPEQTLYRRFRTAHTGARKRTRDRVREICTLIGGDSHTMTPGQRMTRIHELEGGEYSVAEMCNALEITSKQYRQFVKRGCIDAKCAEWRKLVREAIASLLPTFVDQNGLSIRHLQRLCTETYGIRPGFQTVKNALFNFIKEDSK